MPRAYYNEIDEQAAQWLRNLIAAGVIAAGDVDTRSIVEVRASDLVGYTQCHFFAGIGVWSYALRRAGWPDDRPVWTGSCPCQPFSDAGEKAEFGDERHLWPTWFELIRECRPVSLFGEQVASKSGLAWLDLVHADLESAAYTVGAVDTCAAGFGAPHIRQRFFFVADSGGERVRDCGREADARAPRGVEGEGLQRERLRDDARHDSRVAAGWMADAKDADGRPRECGAEAGARQDRFGRFGPAGGRVDGEFMDDAERARLEGHERHVGDRDESGRNGTLAIGSAAEAGGARGTVADDDERGREEQPPSRLHDHGESGNDAARRGPVNGLWRNADWLACRDGRARPVEPGVAPLAYGLAARVGQREPAFLRLARRNRVLRLRGYGNAINAEQAREFVMAYLDLERAHV